MTSESHFWEEEHAELCVSQFPSPVSEYILHGEKVPQLCWLERNPLHNTIFNKHVEGYITTTIKVHRTECSLR